MFLFVIPLTTDLAVVVAVVEDGAGGAAAAAAVVEDDVERGGGGGGGGAVAAAAEEEEAEEDGVGSAIIVVAVVARKEEEEENGINSATVVVAVFRGLGDASDVGISGSKSNANLEVTSSSGISDPAQKSSLFVIGVITRSLKFGNPFSSYSVSLPSSYLSSLSSPPIFFERTGAIGTSMFSITKSPVLW